MTDIVIGTFSIAFLTAFLSITLFALVTTFIRLSVSFSPAAIALHTFLVAVHPDLITLPATFFISVSRGDNTATFFHRTLVILVSLAKSLASVTALVISGNIALVSALLFNAHLIAPAQDTISSADIVLDTHLATLLLGSPHT